MPFGLTADEFKQKASRAKDATVSSVTLTANRFKSASSSKAKWGLGVPPQPPPPDKTKPRSTFPPPPSRRPSQYTNQDEAEDEEEPLPPAAARTPSMPSRTSRPAIAPVREGDVRPAMPPPPPSRTRSTGPPPVVAPRRAAAGRNGISDVDWANLSREDKEVLFSWLDEFFARHLKLDVSVSSEPVSSSRTPIEPATATKQSVPATTTSTFASSRGPPPQLAKWSKPSKSSATAASDSELVMSHPPPTKTGSAAEDFAQYFLPSTHWDAPWYNSNSPVPHTLKGNTHVTYSTSCRTSGRNVTLCSGVTFSDLSVCWYTVKFSTSTGNKDPNNTSLVKRSARYIGRPRALDRAALVQAHETYGETIAVFAENFVGTGEYCARGECWDLADQALKYFEDFDYVPKPVPSLSRTHGHLIFEGRAEAKGRMVGRWRGGDDRVRRGDIVEWRKVKINLVGARANSWVILGEPDHTAIVVRDSKPSRVPVEGETLSPAELGSLEVVEQSVGSPPDRRVYDMAAMEKGEVWIYRPISLEAYVGTLLGATCPPGVRAVEI